MPKSQLCSPTEHFLLSAYGSKWKEVSLAMFTVYVDDSGTDPKQPTAIAAALIIPGSQIIALENAWEKFKHCQFITEFHSSECVAGKEKSEFEGWSSQRKKRVCWQVREITKQFSAYAFSIAISKKDFDEVVTGELRDFGGRFHYSWAVWHLLRNLDAWAVFHNVTEPFEFVFDWMGESKRNEAKREIETVMAQWEAMKPGFFDGHYSFRKRQLTPGLQCSDLLAWSCYQYARSAFYRSPIHPIAWETFWDYDAFKNRGWITAITQTREQLQHWVELEAADDVRKERRRKWGELYGKNIRPKN
jgi:hypothetical protein